MAKDMTQGSISKTLALFSIPLVLSGLLQQLYGWADALIVGNVLGEGPLAAIGATNTISTMFTVLISGFSVGVSILAARAYGQGDHQAISRITSTFALCLTLCAAALTGVGVAVARPMLRLLGTPQDIFEQSLLYLNIIYYGMPFMALYNLYSAVLRGIGDSRTPLYAIAVSSAANVALDLMFVAGLGWGVSGAAAATILSQILMCLFLTCYSAARFPLLRFRLGRGMVDGRLLAQGLRLGIPTALQSGMHALGGLMLQGVMNSFGTETVAAVTTAYRIDSVALLPVINLGSGVSTFVAQNAGAGNRARAQSGLKAGSFLAVGVSMAIVAIVVPLGSTILRLFGVSEPVVAIGRELLFTLAAFYPVFALMNALSGYLQGLGDVVFTGTANVGALGLRICLSYALAPWLGRRVIGWAELISWVAVTLVFLWRVRIQQKRARAQTGAVPLGPS